MDLHGNSVEAETFGHTSSGDSLPTAKKWLHDCIQNHEACNREHNAQARVSWYLTRLIYLGDDDRNVRLIITAKECPAGPYITLSHRWGSLQFIKLSKSNMESFCDDIPAADMPKTFQDAVITAQQLGAQYLWIGSL
jgi:hypothetical protein